MPWSDSIPRIEKCCGCITDLKTASAIIAILAIVTSPMVSWAAIRHMYLVKVSCMITTSASRPDVVDINMNNALSFGFGVSPGLGSSCLHRNTTGGNQPHAGFVSFVRCSGWLVLIADGAFVISSINFLVKLFKDVDKKASLYFVVAGLISVVLAFIYGMLYVSACMYMGGIFPVFEFFFACFDLILWTYYLTVVYSFRRKTARSEH